MVLRLPFRKGRTNEFFPEESQLMLTLKPMQFSGIT